MRKEINNQSTSPSIQEKIEQAHNLYGVCGHLLKQDPSISALLKKLQSCINNTVQSMLRLGVVAECKSCEEEQGGSCCGAGIEDRYDVFLLLTNLLLGASLQNGQANENSCYFLGRNGCTLTARHVLCVNYICEKLQKKLSTEQLIELQTFAGEELDTGFILHEAIKKRLRAKL